MRWWLRTLQQKWIGWRVNLDVKRGKYYDPITERRRLAKAARGEPKGICQECGHHWGDHYENDGCYGGWNYDSEGNAVDAGCPCMLSHDRRQKDE